MKKGSLAYKKSTSVTQLINPKMAADKTDPDLKAGDGADTDVDDEGKDDELIEDTSDLGEDDDDMSEVKEHIDDGVEDKT